MPKYLPPFLALFLVIPLLVACNGTPIQNVQPTSIETPEIATQPAPTQTLIPTIEENEPPVAQQNTPTPITLSPTQTPTFPPSISLERFASVPGQITYLTHAGDDSGRIFLVEKKGRVSIIEDSRVQEDPFLDITGMVESGGSEQGLLSIAFDPDYATTGEFYVNFTSRVGDGDTAILRYRVSADPSVADPNSGQVILTIDQPAGNHNGGQIQFGPDGYLYIGTGDGGSANDPWDNAENLGELLGKMLRIDVRGQNSYVIPADNPFLDHSQARSELWAYGLRNPWRFSFDRATGDLYIGDVGQNRWEEIDWQPASSAGGEHYGWDTMEGNHCFEPENGCDTIDKVLPITEYGHDEGCSVTGGYVYRGQQFPELNSIYFYGDFCTGRIWALQPTAGGGWQSAAVLDSDVNIASFGEDEAGELYVLDLGGDVFRLVAE